MYLGLILLFWLKYFIQSTLWQYPMSANFSTFFLKYLFTLLQKLYWTKGELETKEPSARQLV